MKISTSSRKLPYHVAAWRYGISPLIFNPISHLLSALTLTRYLVDYFFYVILDMILVEFFFVTDSSSEKLQS